LEPPEISAFLGKERTMKEHKADDQPDRQDALKAKLDDQVSELIAEANDEGYGTEEALEAVDEVVENQKVIYSEDEDPANDPE
jgi:DNA-binding transcriptional regulator YhcF (GntR family)